MAAIEFLRQASEGKYDAIIVDSSDPVGMTNYIDSFKFRDVHYFINLIRVATNKLLDMYLDQCWSWNCGPHLEACQIG